MALIQAIVSLITQTVGRILSALLDWAVVSLFGRVTGNRKLFLWGMMAAAAAWPVLLLGVVAPKAALWVFNGYGAVVKKKNGLYISGLGRTKNLAFKDARQRAHDSTARSIAWVFSGYS